MARSLASLVLDQAKQVTELTATLVSNLTGVRATAEQETLFSNITQQLMVIKDQLRSENQQALERQGESDSYPTEERLPAAGQALPERGYAIDGGQG